MGGYCSSSDVAALTPNLVNAASDYSASTVPTQTQLNTWISAGSSLIDNALKSRGYAVPTDTTTSPFIQLRDLNTLYAAAKAEMARANTRLAPGERTRGQVFAEDFRKGLEDFFQQDLSLAGLTHTNYGYVGGISEDERITVEDDTNRTPMRFTRGKFDNPE